MRPVDIQPIGEELAVKWEDGSESFINLQLMRRACPCASCAGEKDIMGNLHKGPEATLQPNSFVLARFGIVGGYGFQPQWADGHNTGIFAFDHLKRLAELPNN
ncbi:MAG: hypothetical protein CMO80_12755 [Verrucomicrobiales bacterium]|nr:hypothetical protein [Verrucomicrobiales bacterium]